MKNKHRELVGNTEPRIYTPPLKPLNEKTSQGYLFIDFCENILHFELLPWQKWLAIHLLELDNVGGFRYSQAVIEVPRQNGKTTFLKALGIFFFLIIRVPYAVVTAQSLDKANEIWEEAIADITANEDMNALVKSITRGNSGKVCTLVDGSRFSAYASNRTAMRGKSLDFVIFDEIREQYNWDGWNAVSGTTTARPNSMLICASNAGTAESVVLRHFRDNALSSLGYTEEVALKSDENASDDAVGWFEWSADPQLDPADPEAWVQANPSLGYGFLTEHTIRTKLSTMPRNDFKIEHLCQWVLSTVTPPFENQAWELALDNRSKIEGDNMVFGIDLNEKRTQTSLAVCGMRRDRTYHVELITQRTGIVWLFDWLAKQGAKHPIKVAVQARGCPIASYINTLKEIKGVELVECEGRDIGAWTGRFYDAVMANSESYDGDAIPVHHLSQEEVDKPAMCAVKKMLGDGAWTWNRKDSLEDVSPLMAETLAFGLFTAGKSEYRVKYQSSYTSDRGLVMV